ncbi:hypothetical protein V6N11_053906 [Hibiscus sabdariffa]|uniref:Uncharacterized protein n=1 Tax=Hibiscus sabdariffa TaxID=183260 RepID=A0ABR2S2L9_9ROSI
MQNPVPSSLRIRFITASTEDCKQQKIAYERQSLAWSKHTFLGLLAKIKSRAWYTPPNLSLKVCVLNWFSEAYFQHKVCVLNLSQLPSDDLKARSMQMSSEIVKGELGALDAQSGGRLGLPGSQSGSASASLLEAITE